MCIYGRCVIGREGRDGEGSGGSVPTLCVLWSALSLLQAFRARESLVSNFLIAHELDSEAGVVPISLCYCCTKFCSIFGHECMAALLWVCSLV